MYGYRQIALGVMVGADEALVSLHMIAALMLVTQLGKEFGPQCGLFFGETFALRAPGLIHYFACDAFCQGVTCFEVANLLPGAAYDVVTAA